MGIAGGFNAGWLEKVGVTLDRQAREDSKIKGQDSLTDANLDNQDVCKDLRRIRRGRPKCVKRANFLRII